MEGIRLYFGCLPLALLLESLHSAPPHTIFSHDTNTERTTDEEHTRPHKPNTCRHKGWEYDCTLGSFIHCPPPSPKHQPPTPIIPTFLHLSHHIHRNINPPPSTPSRSSSQPPSSRPSTRILPPSTTTSHIQPRDQHRKDH
ncbi:hypothetical protein ACFE04_020768 [Oxalis oulophora]